MASLLGLQVVWGGDVYFFPTHAMIRSPIKKVADLLAGGFRKKYDERLATMQTYSRVRELLPADAHLLLHENHNHLGVGVTSVSDWVTYQFGVSYGLLSSPRDVYDTLRRLRVTHLHWLPTSRSWDSLAGDIMFYDFATRFTKNKQRLGSATVAQMPDQPPADAGEHFVDVAAILGCGSPYRTGLYRVQDLRTPTFGPARTDYAPARRAASSPQAAVGLVEHASVVVLDPTCEERFNARWKRNFAKAVQRKRVPKLRNRTFQIWIRTRGKARPGGVAEK